MATTIADCIPAGAETGASLCLQDGAGRYVFFVAGSRYQGLGPAGERFYAGIGGHLEPGETWLQCVQREALEEIGLAIEVLPAEVTWYVAADGSVCSLSLSDVPRPLALCEMIHPAGTPRAGQLYRIVIYRAVLPTAPAAVAPQEVAALVALTAEQVVAGVDRRLSVAEVLTGGGAFQPAAALPPDTRLYPIGTAAALGRMLRHVGGAIG